MGKEISTLAELNQYEIINHQADIKLWGHDNTLSPALVSIGTLLSAVGLHLADVPSVTQLAEGMTVLGVSSGSLVQIPVSLLSAPVEYGNLRFDGAAVLFNGANVNISTRSFGNLRLNGAAVLFNGANVNF